jgi:hypothetical protein
LRIRSDHSAAFGLSDILLINLPSFAGSLVSSAELHL